MIWLAGGADRAGQPHPYTGGLLEGVGRGVENDVTADFAEALG